MTVDMIQLRQALEKSWCKGTSYEGVYVGSNPALGQCYPTSRVVQFYFPDTEIVEGEVWVDNSREKHFWNILVSEGVDYHIDFTWCQFPAGAVVKRWHVRDRHSLEDSQGTITRVAMLLDRVKEHLNKDL